MSEPKKPQVSGLHPLGTMIFAPNSMAIHPITVIESGGQTDTAIPIVLKPET